MTANQEKLLKINEKLNTGDAIIRAKAADEMMDLIRGTADVDMKIILANQIINVLADLDNILDWDFCFQLLSHATKPEFRFSAIFAKAWRLKKNPALKIADLISVYQEGVKLSEETYMNDKKSIFLMCLGKCFLLEKQNDLAFDAFTQSIALANNVKNYSLVAIDTYYIGVLLQKNGFSQCAIDKLREASNLAIDNKNGDIAQFTEVVRAYYTLLLGDVEEATFILKDWYKHFGFML